MRVSPQEKMVCDAIKSAVLTARPRTSFTRLAPHVGMTYDRLNNLANGRTVPTEEDVSKIRRALKLPKTWPYDTLRSDGLLPGQRVSLAGTRMAPLPISGNVAAGFGLWNVDVDKKEALVPERMAQVADLGFIVDGDSMMPFLEEGDTAAFKRQPRPRNGHVFLLKTAQNGYRIKLLHYERGEWFLDSLNPSYVREAMATNTQVLGVLVGFYRTRGTRERMELDPEGLRPD